MINTKKIFIFGLSIFLLTGCGNSKVDDINKDNNDSTTSNVQENAKENINLSNIKSKIKELGITITEGETYFQMVGASDGIKLYYDDSRVEIYKFDSSSSEYKKAESNQKLEISDEMAFDAVVKNGYAYIIDDDFPQHDAVIGLLNKLN